MINTNKLFIFGLGVAAGSLLSIFLLEKKYKQLSDEELEIAVKDYNFKHKNDNLNMKNEYHDLTAKYSGEKGEEEKDNTIINIEQPKDHPAPYVISPDEFGETQYYNNLYFTYYSDGVLTDEYDQIVSEPNVLIGDALEHFGEYADNVVHVRNENTECDYEIVRYEKPFNEVKEHNV